MPSFLFKTEPSAYSYDDLARDRRAVWDGVSNPHALSHLRKVARGDVVAIYHTGDERAVVGLATATSAAYPDPKLDDPKRVVVDLKPTKRLKHPVALATFKTDPVLRTVELVRIPRLSVMPLSDGQLERLLAHAESGPEA